MRKIVALTLLVLVLASVALASLGPLPLLDDDPTTYTVHLAGPPVVNKYVAVFGDGHILVDNVVLTLGEDNLYHAASPNSDTWGFDGYDTGDATNVDWPTYPALGPPTTSSGSYDHD